MKKEIIKISAIVLSTTILASSLGTAGASAATLSKKATSTKISIPGKVTYPAVGKLSSKEVEMIMRNAGYTSANSKPGTVHKMNVFTSLAKKVAVGALRSSAPWVEKALSKVIGKKYAAKVAKSFRSIANYIERVQKVQEYAISSILVHAGLPPDVAWETAHWMVLFFGL